MKSKTRKPIAVVLLIVAAALLAMGNGYSRKIYDKPDDAFAEFGLRTFSRVTDRDLTIDATFTGVTRKDGLLFSTYDRSQPRGKQTCPT